MIYKSAAPKAGSDDLSIRLGLSLRGGPQSPTHFFFLWGCYRAGTIDKVVQQGRFGICPIGASLYEETPNRHIFCRMLQGGYNTSAARQQKRLS